MKHTPMRATALILAALLAMSLCGCSSDEGDMTATTTTSAVATTVATTTTQHGVLDASDVIVRDGAGFGHNAIGGITYGEDIIIIGREGDWYKIQFGDGVGYISAHYVDVDGALNADEMAAALPTTAPAATTVNGTTITAAGSTIMAAGATSATDVVTTTTGKAAIPTAEAAIPAQ